MLSQRDRCEHLWAFVKVSLFWAALRAAAVSACIVGCWQLRLSAPKRWNCCAMIDCLWWDVSRPSCFYVDWGIPLEDRHDRSKHRLQQLYIGREKTWTLQWWRRRSWNFVAAYRHRRQCQQPLRRARDRSHSRERSVRQLAICRWHWQVVWLAVWWWEWQMLRPFRLQHRHMLWTLLDRHIPLLHFHRRRFPNYFQQCISIAKHSVGIPKLLCEEINNNYPISE